MSNKALNQVWEHSKAKGAAFTLLIAIADASNDNGECWMAVGKLAKKARVTDRYVPTLTQQLEALGELEVYPFDGAQTSHGYTNRYVVTGLEGVNYKQREKKERKGGRPKRDETSSSQEMKPENTDSTDFIPRDETSSSRSLN